jgi:hypothetical protein
MSSTFHTGFDIHNYKDILPSVHKYREDDVILNEDLGDINDCVWKVEEPKIWTPEMKCIEIKRCMDTGGWIFIKDMPVWIPPNYYMFLRFFKTGGARPEFRINRLMDIYEKIRTRKNEKLIGDFTIKSRQIGETTMEMSNLLWEVPKLDYGLLGMQSKTRNTVQNSCWRTLIMGWNGLDKWIKDELYSEFISGVNVAESMKFVKQAGDGDAGKNVMITYAAGSHNAFDSINNMRKVVLDEWLKWEEASPYSTFLNYEKFIANGTTRKGLFSIISSPADIETRYAAECYDFWKGSDATKLNDNGTTDTRIARHFTSPLTGIEGFFDKWGDADPQPIYDWIIQKRKSVPKDYRMAEVRAYPLNEEEIFGSFESGNMWSNAKGIANRKIYIIGARFKDEKTKEPKVVYGNLEWKDGVKDYKPEFRMSDKTQFDIYDARFCFSYLPQDSDEPLQNIFNPPNYVENCIGIDSVDKRYPGKRPSNFAMVNYKFLDLKGTGIVKCPTMIYCERPLPIEISYQDAIKAAVFLRAKVQVEALNSKIVDYFEDHGYINWLISKIGHPKNSLMKGDAPSGKSAFIDEMVAMIDAATNVPINESDPHNLELHWFHELLEDISKFNIKDTHERDLSMAFGQSLLGAAKLLFKKVRQPSELNNGVLDYLLG